MFSINNNNCYFINYEYVKIKILYLVDWFVFMNIIFNVCKKLCVF